MTVNQRSACNLLVGGDWKRGVWRSERRQREGLGFEGGARWMRNPETRHSNRPRPPPHLAREDVGLKESEYENSCAALKWQRTLMLEM